MQNPMKKYSSLNRATKTIGFEVEYPSRYKLKEIYVISNKILEMRFSSLVVRKAKYDKNNTSGMGISGVFTGAYPSDCFKGEFKDEDVEGVEYWNGSAKRPKAYLAIFNDIKHHYSYSVYAPKGIKLKSMSLWQKKFR